MENRKARYNGQKPSRLVRRNAAAKMIAIVLNTPVITPVRPSTIRTNATMARRMRSTEPKFFGRFMSNSLSNRLEILSGSHKKRRHL